MIVDDSVVRAKATALTAGGTINRDFNPCVHPVYTHTLPTYTYINIYICIRYSILYTANIHNKTRLSRSCDNGVYGVIRGGGGG